MTAWIEDIKGLKAIYGQPSLSSTAKVTDRLTPQYRDWIHASPFCAMATVGPEGTDCSPRGDDGPVVSVVDDRTLALPDRRGNNRIDTLRNIVRDPRISLMFLIPGSGTVMRVNGQAKITADAEVLARYETRGALPRTVTFVSIDEIYFQCARAVMRAKLWHGGLGVDPKGLPTPGQILETMTERKVDGAAYDRDWPGRVKDSMW
ncbi:pyridoxamine 5'-phosphate oxidase family protein [Halovulum sp. GXIMD14793]